MPEKRKFVRLDMKVLVKWKRIPEQTPSSADVMRNISRGGICLTVSETILKGDHLSLQIKLPTQKVITVTSEVVWIKDISADNLDNRMEYDIGCEFLDLRKEDMQELEQFVFEAFSKQ